VALSYLRTETDKGIILMLVEIKNTLPEMKEKLDKLGRYL